MVSEMGGRRGRGRGSIGEVREGEEGKPGWMGLLARSLSGGSGTVMAVFQSRCSLA